MAKRMTDMGRAHHKTLEAAKEAYDTWRDIVICAAESIDDDGEVKKHPPEWNKLPFEQRDAWYVATAYTITQTMDDLSDEARHFDSCRCNGLPLEKKRPKKKAKKAS